MSTSNDTTKRCTKCHQEFPTTLEYFCQDKRSPDNLRANCRKCENLRINAWHKAHPNYNPVRAEYGKIWRKIHPEYDKEWCKANPQKRYIGRQKRRARKRGLPDHFTDADWEKALNYFNGCCAVCGRPPGFWHKLASDHWIPLTSPNCPGTIPANIIPLCHGQGGCNNSKHNRDATEWLVDKYGKKRAAEIMAKIEVYFQSLTITPET